MHTLLWTREDRPGMEMAFVALDAGGLSATGSAIAGGTVPHRIAYSLETGDRYVTKRFTATAEGAGWRRTIDLVRHADGRWSCTATSDGESDLRPAGANVDALDGVEDVDLGYSPLTNTPPVLRAGLLEDRAPSDIDAAWISVPDLAVERLEQRYTLVGRNEREVVVRYESGGGSFTADLTLDADGFVVRYPGLATRIG